MKASMETIRHPRPAQVAVGPVPSTVQPASRIAEARPARATSAEDLYLNVDITARIGSHLLTVRDIHAYEAALGGPIPGLYPDLFNGQLKRLMQPEIDAIQEAATLQRQVQPAFARSCQVDHAMRQLLDRGIAHQTRQQMPLQRLLYLREELRSPVFARLVLTEQIRYECLDRQQSALAELQECLADLRRFASAHVTVEWPANMEIALPSAHEDNLHAHGLAIDSCLQRWQLLFVHFKFAQQHATEIAGAARRSLGDEHVRRGVQPPYLSKLSVVDDFLTAQIAVLRSRQAGLRRP